MRTATVLAGLIAAGPALAQDRAELDPSRIVGNRELPKVIYIVPWKKPLPDPLTGKPPASLVDEVLAPLDREVHRRRLRYAEATATPTESPTKESPR